MTTVPAVADVRGTLRGRRPLAVVAARAPRLTWARPWVGAGGLGSPFAFPDFLNFPCRNRLRFISSREQCSYFKAGSGLLGEGWPAAMPPPGHDVGLWGPKGLRWPERPWTGPARTERALQGARTAGPGRRGRGPRAWVGGRRQEGPLPDGDRQLCHQHMGHPSVLPVCSLPAHSSATQAPKHTQTRHLSRAGGRVRSGGTVSLFGTAFWGRDTDGPGRGGSAPVVPPSCSCRQCPRGAGLGGGKLCSNGGRGRGSHPPAPGTAQRGPSAATGHQQTKP